MDTVHSWRTPHLFLYLSAAHSGPRYVFTYGLTVTELARADELTSERLLARVGAPWIASLVDELRPRRSGRSGLGRFFRAQEVVVPGQPSASAMLGKEIANELPASALQALASDRPDGRRTLDFICHELGPFAADLEAQAKSGKRPSPALVADMRRFVQLYPPTVRPAPLHKTGSDRTYWGVRHDTLLERLSLELFELYSLRPRLRRCIFCEAVFVPTSKEANCRWHLHDFRAPETTISTCTPEEKMTAFKEREADMELAHRRKRKRLHESYRRTRQAFHGNENAGPVQKAKREYDEYMALHRKRPGPKPHTIASEADFCPS